MHPSKAIVTLVVLFAAAAAIAGEETPLHEPDAAFSASLKALAQTAPDGQEWLEVGDILVRRDMAAKGAFGGSAWPGGVVPVCMAGFTQAQRDAVRAAIDPWTINTGVRYIEDCDAIDRVNVLLDPPELSAGACGNSALGRIGLQQPLRLRSASLLSDPGCALHEMGHALGLIHEHQRPDRDNFVEILTANICGLSEAQIDTDFGRFSNASTFNLPYDFASVMHYTRTAFGCTVNGVRQQTIRARPTASCGSPPSSANCEALMGRRNPPSSGDLAAMAQRYPAGAPFCHVKFAPSIVGPADSSTLSWLSGNGDLVQVTSTGTNPVSPSGSQTVPPSGMTGARSLTLQANGAGGATARCLAIQSIPVAGPPSCNVSYSPGSIAPAQTSTLSWSSVGGQMEFESVIPRVLAPLSGSETGPYTLTGTYTARFTSRNAAGEAGSCRSSLLVTPAAPSDEPQFTRYWLPLPNPPNASCPAGFFIASVDDGPGSGLTPGIFGVEILLDDPGTRLLDGGLNFGGLIDAGQAGFAGFNFVNAANEMQRVTLNLTGASSSGGTLPVRVSLIRQTTAGNQTVFETTRTINLSTPFVSSIDLTPGFYVATVEATTGTIGGAAEGQYFLGLQTSFTNRPGGGFQGGAVVGGYHAQNPAGGVSGFAGFCLGTQHSASIKVLSQPTYGVTGARDLRLRVQDAQQRVFLGTPAN